MAQLKDTVVSGNLRVTDTVLTKDVETDTINGSTPITSGNIGSQSVNYANSAGSASSASYASSAGSAPASDVYDWAKASSKPSYSWSEINSRPTALSSFTNDVGYITSYTDTNTWRPITNTYTGSDEGTSVSQYGTNAMYNALVNGYASTAGDAATVSGHTVAKDVPADAVFTDTNTWPSYTSQLTNNSGFITASDSCAYATSAGSASSASSAGMVDTDAGLPIRWRQHESYRSGVYYSTSGNESVVFANANGVTSWMFATTDPNTQADWTTVIPSLQIKNQRVTINKQIANGYDASYNLDVNGSANASTLYENGSRVITASNIGSQSVSYASSAGSAPASDVYSWAKASSKPSYSWSEISSRPTALSSFTNDSGYITSSGSCSYATSAGSAPASDVYSWAKQSSKPSYSWSEISSRPTALSSFTNDSGYITGINSSMVTSALGYTPLSSHQSLAGYALDTAIVAQSSSSFTAAVNNYYDFADAIGTMTVTLPSISNTGYTQGFLMHFTTSSSPSLTFTSADGKAIEYYADYAIAASTKYEISCLFNGTKWTIAYAKID